MSVAEAAYLISKMRSTEIRIDQCLPRQPEHSHLLIQVAEVRDLQSLWKFAANIASIRAEESRSTDAELSVTCRIQHMAEITRQPSGCRLVEVQIASGLLVRRERVVQLANRVRRLGDLEGEVGERLHFRWRNPARTAEQRNESLIKLLERLPLVE